jgi:hypothetical protein
VARDTILLQFHVLCFCFKLKLVPDRGHFFLMFYAWYPFALKHLSASLVAHLAGFLLIVQGSKKAPKEWNWRNPVKLNTYTVLPCGCKNLCDFQRNCVSYVDKQGPTIMS